MVLFFIFRKYLINFLYTTIIYTHFLFSFVWSQLYIWYFCSLTRVLFIYLLSDAEIHVMCGGQVASSVSTNGNGKFLFSKDHQRYTVPIILKICNLVVISPLSWCPKPTLGHLESSLNYVGDTISGDLKISSIIPVGFQDWL